MMTAADRIGIPILLLSGLWGVFEVTLKAFEKLNERRDLYLKLADDIGGYGKLTAHTIFLNDWLPLWIATVAFMALFTIIMLRIPEFLNPETPTIRKHVQHICWIAACLPAFGFVGFLVGGIGDIIVLFR